MVLQVRGFAQRCALRQAGRTHREQDFGQHLAIARPGRRLGPGIDADIDILAVEVGVGVRGGDLHVDLRVEGVEADEPRHQPAHGEGRRQFQPQPVLVGAALELRGSRFEQIERALGDIEEQLPLWRELDATVNAREQLHLQPLLEAGDMAADRALRDAQLVSRTREAAISGR
jgi:hypothetical protein